MCELKNEIFGVSSADILKSLADNYVSVHFFDIDEDTYVNIKTSPRFEKALEGITSIREAFERNIEIIIKPEDWAEAREFYNIDTLSERLGDKSIISYEYEGNLRGYCIGSFIPVTRKEDGTIKTAAYLVRLVDDERRSGRNKDRVINALSKGFLNVYWANPSQDIGKIIKLNGYVTRGLDDKLDSEFSYTEAIANYANARVYEKDKDRFMQSFSPDHLERYLENEGEYNISYRIVEDDGSIHHYQGKAVKSDEEGWAVLAFQNIDDLVEEEKKRADELQDALERAERASQSKTDFLSHMSHDIRTPMNGIVGMAHIMEAEIDNKEIIKDSIGKIKELSNQLDILINDVLEMSRIESRRIKLSREVVDLQALIRNLRPALQVMAEEKGVTLHRENYDCVHTDIFCSPAHLQRIVMNIATNLCR